MATGTLKIGNNYLNPYEYYHNLLKGNAAFREDDWRYAYNTNSLPELISMMTDKDAPNLNLLEKEYGYNFLDSERRQIALYNELYGSRTNMQEIEEDYIDETGVQQKRTIQISEYDYTKKLLQQARDYELASLQMEQEQIAKNEMSFFAKAGSTALSSVLNISGGVLNTIGGLINLAEGVFDGASASIRGEDFRGAFRNAFNDNDFDFADEYQEWLIDWERKNSYNRDINGNYTFVGKLLGGTATAIGEMLPTLALSFLTSGVTSKLANTGRISSASAAAISNTVGKASHAIYYTSMSSNNFKQMSLDMPTVPTTKLIVNASLKTAAEICIEKLLTDSFGSSTMDMLHFNYAPSGIKNITTKSVLSQFAKDFIQEGSEELLQDFSGYLIDQFFAIKQEEFGDSEWTFQTMFDAFIIGGLTTISFNAANIISTERVVLSDVSYDKDDNLIKNKKGENVPTKLSKGKSWLYKQNISSAFNMYDKIINDKTMTLAQRSAALGQMYVSYRNISSLFAEIGQERFESATKMLEEINRRSMLHMNTDRNISDVATSLAQDLLSKYADGSLLNSYNKQMLNKIKISKVDKVVNKSDDTSKIQNESENVKKTVNQVFKLNTNLKDVIITEDGTNTIENKNSDSIIIPKKLAEIGDGNIVYKAIAEQTLQNMILASKEFEPILKEFKKIYLQVYNVNNVEDSEVLLHALFDDTFYRILIYSVNKDAVRFLTNIDNIVDSVQIKNGKDAIFKNTTVDVLKNIKKHLIDYCINQQNIIVNTIPVLDNKERLYIKQKRHLIDTSNRILKTDFGSKEDDKAILELVKNKISNSSADNNTKNQWLKDINSTNSRTRAAVLEDLDDYYSNVFFGPYNDKVYKKEKWIGDTILNTFLINSNLRLDTIYNESSYDANVINELNLNSISTDLFKRKAIFDYLNTKFKEYTNNKYELDIVNNVLEVKQVGAINMSSDITNSVSRKLPNIKPLDINLFNDVLKDMPSTLKNYISLNDLIVNYEKYLKLDKLKKYYDNLTTPLNIYRALSKYIEQKSKGNYGLTITPNNEVILMCYEYDESILNKNIDRILVNLLHNFDKNTTYKMSELFQEVYLTDFLSDVNIRVDGTDSDSYGYYDNKVIVLNIEPIINKLKKNLKGNDITIKVGNSTLSQLKKTLLHEFHHAVADENNLSPGLGLMSLSEDVKKDLFSHIDGLEREISYERTLQMTEYNRNISSDTLLAKFLYDRVNGELNAEGKVYYDWPFIRDKDNRIITPWGAIYYIGDDNSVYMKKSKSNRLSYRISKDDITDKIRSTKAKNRDRKGFKEPGKYDKSRYVAAKDAKGTLLEPYIGREISTNLRQLITSFDINKVDSGQKGKAGRKLYNLIQSGNINRMEVFDILRNSKRQEVDNYTFSLINDAYFRNPNIKTMDQLVALSDRYVTELWALSQTLLYRDAQEGTDYKKYLTKKVSIATMLDLIAQVQSSEQWNEVYKYYLKRSQIVFDPTKKVEYSIEIDDANLRIITMHTFDGTIESGQHALARARFIASRNYKTPKGFNTISLSYETNEGDTTLEESLADKYAAEGYTSLIAERDKMESDMRTFYLERYYNDNPDATQDDIRKFISEKQEMLEEATDEELISLWRNSIVGEYAGEYATDKALEYKYEGRDPKKIRANVNKLKDKILDVINHNTKPVKNKFIKSNSKYFEFDDKNNVLFKEGILRVGKRPITLRTDQLAELEHDLSIIWTAINEGSYVRAKLAKETNSKIKELEHTVKEQKKAIKQLTKDVKNIKEEYIKLGTTTFNIDVEKNEHINNIPDALTRILSYSFTEFATSNIKFSSEDNMVISGKKFFEDNAELLSQLTSDEITDIINFYKYANFDETSADINTARKYEAFRLYLLGYFAEMHHKKDSGIVLTDEQMKDIKYIVEKSTKIYATNLPIATSVIRKIEPEKVLAKRLNEVLGVELSEEEALALSKLIHSTDFSDKRSVDSLMKHFEFYYSLAVKRSERPNIWDRLWRFQRMAMLSSPGTWFRNLSSNFVVKNANKLSEFLGQAFSKNSKHIKGQWTIANVKVDSITENFVKDVFEDSGLIDMLSVNTKYDTKSAKTKHSKEILTDMILSSLNSRLFHENQFASEYTTKKGKKIQLHTNKIAQIVYKCLDDDPWVKSSALRYFKSMLQEHLDNERNKLLTKEYELKAEINALDLSDKLRKTNKKEYKKNLDKRSELNRKIDDLHSNYNSILDTKNVSTDILNMFAEAYSLASYDYMHRPNMFSKIERALHHHLGSAGYFVYKQILPFAGASWNWFVESLKYTPAGLVASIFKLHNLEKQIDKITAKREAGYAVPSEKFTEYIIKRDIGKGTIGSVLFGIGVLLWAFGLAGVDEEDDKIKIHVGDIYIDISDIFGTNSIFLGIATMENIMSLARKKNYDFIDFTDSVADFVADSLDQMFMDSTFSDIFNLFRYDKTVGEYIVDNVDNTISMFIMNFIKTSNSILYFNKAQYNKGLPGLLERWSTSLVPFLSYTLPTRFDPYTGEKQSKYKWPFVIDTFNRLSPIKISYYNVSDAEKTALKYGVRKGELTGNYEDVGQLNAVQISQLNEYYGKLNSTSLAKLFENRQTYKVWNDEKKKYETIRFNAMNDEQKKNVIERIMNDNAKVAKAYVLTNNGYKYYTNENEMKYLQSLGIKNIYKETKTKEGFIK